MNSRLGLQTMLEKLLGSRNVYFQPPESIKVKFPEIIYSLSDIRNMHASNTIHKKDMVYMLTYIDEDPDSENVEKISNLPYCEFDRFYTSDNLNHYIFTIYY